MYFFFFKVWLSDCTVLDGMHQNKLQPTDKQYVRDPRCYADPQTSWQAITLLHISQKQSNTRSRK